jgi:outer membrane protein assembly factor BamB
VYVAFAKSLYAFSSTGGTLWSLGGTTSFSSSPILADGTLYVGQTNGLVMAIGGCAS